MQELSHKLLHYAINNMIISFFNFHGSPKIKVREKVSSNFQRSNKVVPHLATLQCNQLPAIIIEKIKCITKLYKYVNNVWDFISNHIILVADDREKNENHQIRWLINRYQRKKKFYIIMAEWKIKRLFAWANMRIKCIPFVVVLLMLLNFRALARPIKWHGIICMASTWFVQLLHRIIGTRSCCVLTMNCLK